MTNTIKHCPTSGKIMYETYGDAEIAIEESKYRAFNVKLGYYKCVYCFHFHLTEER